MDKEQLIELFEQLSEWQQDLVIKAIEYMIQQKGKENESTEEEATSA